MTRLVVVVGWLVVVVVDCSVVEGSTPVVSVTAGADVVVVSADSAQAATTNVNAANTKTPRMTTFSSLRRELSVPLLIRSRCIGETPGSASLSMPECTIHWTQRYSSTA